MEALFIAYLQEKGYHATLKTFLSESKSTKSTTKSHHNTPQKQPLRDITNHQSPLKPSANVKRYATAAADDAASKPTLVRPYFNGCSRNWAYSHLSRLTAPQSAHHHPSISQFAPIMRLTGHSDLVASLQFSKTAPLRQLFTCSWDNTFRLWDLGSGKATLIRGPDQLVAAVWDELRGAIYAISLPNKLMVFDVATRMHVKTITAPQSAAVQCLAMACVDGKTVVVVGADRGYVMCFDVSSGACLNCTRVDEETKMAVRALCVPQSEPSYVYMATGLGLLKGHVLDLGASCLVARPRVPCDTMSLSPLSEAFVVASAAGHTPEIYSVETGRRVVSYDELASTGNPVLVDGAPCVVVPCLTPQNVLWCPRSGGQLMAFDGKKEVTLGCVEIPLSGSEITCVACDPLDGSLLAVAEESGSIVLLSTDPVAARLFSRRERKREEWLRRMDLRVSNAEDQEEEEEEEEEENEDAE
jgi:WD40 repeat protein